MVAAASAQLSHLEIAMQQFIDNQAAQRGPSPQGDDARERLLHKSQLSEDAAAWKKPNSRKHWFVCGRIPPNIGEAPADIHAFVGEGVHVTARVAAQLRSLTDFDVAVWTAFSRGFHPRHHDRGPPRVLAVGPRGDFDHWTLVGYRR